jgi:tryptophan synthase alpha chain
MIAEASRPFIYAVSRTGVTGERQQIASDASELVNRIRKFTALPIAVGFGISGAEQFRSVGRFADAAVIGSAIVSLIEKHGAGAARPVADFVRGLRLNKHVSNAISAAP